MPCCKAAPPAAQVMAEAARFVGSAPLVAHNASFDSKFWDYELGLLGLQRKQAFACHAAAVAPAVAAGAGS